MRDTHGTFRSSSTDPNEAMVASQQKHIADLVARNKTLEHTTTRLRAAVAEEQERAADAVAQVQKRWEAERSEWRGGCDSLQAAHRIAHLRTAVDADREHAALLEAKEALRRESIARGVRDYKIVLFQAKELELEMRVSQLQRELETANEAREDAVLDVEEEWQERAAILEARCAELVGQLKAAAAEQAQAIREKEKAEVRICVYRRSCGSLVYAVALSLHAFRQTLRLSVVSIPPSEWRLSAPRRTRNALSCSSKPSRPPMPILRRDTPSLRQLLLLYGIKSRSGRHWTNGRTQTWRTSARLVSISR